MGKEVNIFYMDKKYVNFLAHLRKNQLASGDRALNLAFNHTNPAISALGYDGKEELFNQIRFSLCNANYIRKNDNSSQIYITEQGIDTLQQYYQFQLLGRFAKFTKVFQEHFAAFASIISIIMSLIALIVSVCC